MIPAGFEPSIPASERQQTHALDRAATGIASGIFSEGKWVETCSGSLTKMMKDSTPDVYLLVWCFVKHIEDG